MTNSVPPEDCYCFLYVGVSMATFPPGTDMVTYTFKPTATHVTITDV